MSNLTSKMFQILFLSSLNPQANISAESKAMLLHTIQIWNHSKAMRFNLSPSSSLHFKFPHHTLRQVVDLSVAEI